MKINRRVLIIIAALLLCLLFAGVALAKYSRSTEVKNQLELGYKYLQEQKYEEAILAFEKVIKIEPKNVEARVGLAKVYVKVNRHKDAESILKEAIAINRKKPAPYIELGKLYIQQDRQKEAIEILEKGYKETKNEDIKKMLEELKNGPQPPAASLESGSYKEEKTVELKYTGVMKGKIYYTLDGTTPTQKSSVYSEPINIYDGKTILTAVLIDDSGKSSKEAQYEYNLDLPKTAVTFEDKEFEKVIRKIINKETGDVYDTELVRIKYLTITGTSIGVVHSYWKPEGMFQYEDEDGKIFSERGKITSLNDLKWFKNLKSLSIDFNQIKDISILKEFPNLTSVNLDSNSLTDISVLKELKQLKNLRVGDNPISDYSVIGSMTNLTDLNLMCSRLDSISFLANLKNLKHLDLYGNSFSDLSPVRNLSNLETLNIMWTNVTDISILKSVTSLKSLHVSEFKLSDKTQYEEFKKSGIIK